MVRLLPIALLTAVLTALQTLYAAAPARAQEVVDTTFTWRGFTSESTCRVRVFRSARSAGRPVTIVLDELAENRGRSTLDDAPHLVELVARELRVEPDSAFWIFHWGSFSFQEAAPSRKELYFRATFRRSDSGALGTPFWRLINRATVSEYTDRAYR